MRHLTFWAAVLILLMAALVTYNHTEVQAAQPAAATPISDNCVKVATVGLLETYFCETDYGDLFINSFGFMTEVE